MTENILAMSPGIEAVDTGLEKKNELAEKLSDCLADTYLLMIKTQAYHWNVVGPLFHSFHVLTEEHYENLFKAADDIAERVRALGRPAPTSIVRLAGRSVVSEDKSDDTSTEDMISNLVKDHEAIVRHFRETVEFAEDATDVVTADMLTARMEFHEKAIWMLRALASK